ncbi:site-specific integrase [Brevundimonas sp. SPF441]|uniref:site-specific integrase n=1 Tax=Brevundimonas sp. SPF441 TaxID=2663795 RepID=UPI00129D2FE9|nr:site-specific integrase [Brevundimonas sp. SPF441]MRL67387.1 tyrosine-type recombinase/integrase [Brevundimonas sp. SPF441]
MNEQLSLFASARPPPQLPPLPSIIRYYDDFDRVDRRLDNLHEDTWNIHRNGKVDCFGFDCIPEPVRSVVKRVLAETLVGNATATAANYWRCWVASPTDCLYEGVVNAIQQSPLDFRSWWTMQAVEQLSRHQALAFRHLLHWLCRWEVGQWRSADAALVRALPGHAYRKYAGVRDRSSILPHEARSKIVSYLDELSGLAASGRCSSEAARDGAILAVAYQHGLRSKQIAMLDVSDVRILDANTVHIRPTIIKQRSQKVGSRVNRRMQAEWTPLFCCWSEGLKSKSGDKFFQMVPSEITGIVSALSKRVTGTPYATGMFRHTGAQRLADSGASREEVSAYLSHTDTTAADHYIESSPAQNMLVNAALGESPTYQSIAAAMRGDLITLADLLGRPPDQQIAGIPHGIPVSGVGACTAGQSLCTRNPVLSCYTCHKFLPVSDSSIHQQVLSDLRHVVRSFDQPSRIDRVSPAMMQLRVTLEAVGSVLSEMGGSSE